MTEYKNTRIFFEKSDRAVYISHLDLYRTFQRALKRAGIPVWETQGFNKHIYLNFLLPLSLGTTGVREPLDLKIREDISYSEVKNRLNGALPEGMKIISVSVPEMKATKINRAEYEITGKYEIEKLRGFFEKNSIITEKRTKKKGVTEIDLKPLILNTEISENKFTVCLPAGVELMINPALVIDAYKKIERAEFTNIRIVRTEILTLQNERFN